MEKLSLKIYYRDIRYSDENIIKTSVWSIGPRSGKDDKGEYVEIGSWVDNFWFMVAKGKTDKITLCNALKRLRKFYEFPILKYEYIIDQYI